LPFAPSVGPLENTTHLPPNFEQSWNHLSDRQKEQMAAAFRHAPPPTLTAELGWANEYSPATIAQRNEQQQQHIRQQHNPMQQITHHAPAHFAMQQSAPMMSTMPYRSDYSTQSMNGRASMGVRVGPELHNYGPALQQPAQIHELGEKEDIKDWDTAFTAYDRPISPEQVRILPQEIQAQARPETTSRDADELARTAGKLVSTVEHETNAKFKQSNFLNLMRKIRDKQAGIEGTDIVEKPIEQESASPSITIDKGKGREDGNAWNEEFRQSMGRAPTSQQEAVEWGRQHGSSIPQRLAPGPDSLASELEGREMLNDMWEHEDARSEAIERQAMQRAFIGDGGDVDQRRREDAAEFAKYQNIMGREQGSAADARSMSSLEEDFYSLEDQDFVGKAWEGRQGRGVAGGQAQEWGALQQDWDAWQATSAGIQQSSNRPPLSAARAPQYRFHAVNPYVGSSQADINRASASLPEDMQSVLEREAAVQRDPQNADAWLELGVKQQENEREGLAIAALHHAIQLDPSLRDAWLALAVSYTNENDRMSAFEAIERWIEATPEYSSVVQQHQNDSKSESKANQGYAERHERLSNLLIALARHGSLQDRVDADVQVALGVLFNASEDYDKAVDCFTAALGVRPDDWLLYNRLGATLSNSGRSEEALRYYHQALDLRPGFVRCHFNLSISCLNLKMYQDAASHIYTALTLQSESSEEDLQNEQSSSGGVTSSSLWETLRVACELMDRPDLALLTRERDLNRFDPSDFGFGGIEEDRSMEPTM
jgi:peroxin-5